MKINDLRTLIREEIQNELAEAKKKKKKEATEKIMEIIAEAELTEVELEEAFEKLKSAATQAFQKGIATVGLGKYPAPKGEHKITPEALKAAFGKAPAVFKDYMEKYKMNLDQLIKLYQTEEGKEFNNARYWVQTWYDATVKKDEKAIKAWRKSDTNDAYKYLPNPEGAVGLASTAKNSPITPGGI